MIAVCDIFIKAKIGLKNYFSNINRNITKLTFLLEKFEDLILIIETVEDFLLKLKMYL